MENRNILKKDERIDQLYSQDVRIIQNPHYFAFSLDAVLLANFVRPNHRQKLLTCALETGRSAFFSTISLAEHLLKLNYNHRLRIWLNGQLC